MDRPVRVLILEDVEADAVLMLRELERSSIEAVPRRVDSREPFVKELSEFEPDIVLADYSLPAFDGLSALKIVRDLDPDLPFVIVSGTLGEEQAVDTLRMGATDYVLKSRMARLGPAVERALREAGERYLRRRAEERLRSRGRVYASIADNIQDGLVLFRSGKPAWANARACEIIGCSAEEMTPELAVELTVPEDRDRIRQAIDSSRQTGAAPPRLEAWIVRRDRGRRCVEGRCSRITEDDGSLSWLAVMADITEQKLAEAERERMERQVRQSQKLEAIGTLAGGVAHDFNNLLTVIQGQSDLALKCVVGNESIRQSLTEVREAALRAASLTRQLLLFARRQPVRQMAPLDMNAVVTNLAKMLKRLIGEDITLRLDLCEGVSRISGDVGNIEQVITNLVVNSRDALQSGGAISVSTRNVEVDAASSRKVDGAGEGKYVQLSVRDNGVGMSAEVLERVFEPFFTTKERGTGMGLSVVYGIVRDHSGFVAVESQPGKGTLFDVFFPVIPAGEPESVAAPAEPASAGAGAGQRVLVVEDDLHIRELVRQILADAGYIVFVAGKAREAKALFEKERGAIDLIFTDVVLPDVKGTNMVADLFHASQGTRVLFTSGYSDEKSDFDFIRERGYPFIQKPFTVAALLRAVDHALRR